MREKISELLTNLIADPLKATVATISGATTGTLLEVKASLLQIPPNVFEILLRNSAYIISITVGVCSIVSFIQKQIDRKEKKNG
jgi:hypothetical protein